MLRAIFLPLADRLDHRQVFRSFEQQQEAMKKFEDDKKKRQEEEKKRREEEQQSEVMRNFKDTSSILVPRSHTTVLCFAARSVVGSSAVRNRFANDPLQAQQEAMTKFKEEKERKQQEDDRLRKEELARQEKELFERTQEVSFVAVLVVS